MKRPSLRGRADLLRMAMAFGGDAVHRAAPTFGYEIRQAKPPSGAKKTAPASSAVQYTAPVAESAIEIIEGKLAPPRFWIARQFCLLDHPGRQDGEIEDVEPETGPVAWSTKPPYEPAFPPLRTEHSTNAMLREFLAPPGGGREIDVPKVINDMANMRLIGDYPRMVHRHWLRQLTIITDQSRHLAPFWADQEFVIGRIAVLMPNTDIRVIHLNSSSRQLDKLIAETSSEDRLLVLGDLGVLSGNTTRRRQFAELAGCVDPSAAMAFLPFAPSILPHDLRRLWRVQPWERQARMLPVDAEQMRLQAEKLLRLLSPALRIEPGMLRSLRRQVLPQSDPSIEWYAWNHPWAEPQGLSLINIEKSIRLEFDSEPEADRRKALSIIRAWRGGNDRNRPHEDLWFAELLNLSECSRTLIDQAGESGMARRYFGAIAAQWTQGRMSRGSCAWLSRLGSNTGQAWQNKAFRQAVWAVKRHDKSFVPPLSPGELPHSGVAVGDIPIHQRGPLLILGYCDGTGSAIGNLPSNDGQIEIEEVQLPPCSKAVLSRPVHAGELAAGTPVIGGGTWSSGDHSPVADIGLPSQPEAHRPDNVHAQEAQTHLAGDPARNMEKNRARLVDVRMGVKLRIPATPFILRTDMAELRVDEFVSSLAQWASHTGRDRYGLFTEITIGSVVQRLRWIPPGKFVMGSPETEHGRRKSEGPQHDVVFGSGFWLFDTPVSQALWEVAGVANPSEFQSPGRPVENVSWYDALEFIERINHKHQGLALSLPSEAAWEYACRAGTRSPTYADRIDPSGQNRSALLDDIAWYHENSDIGFDMENVATNRSVQDATSPRVTAGTRLVRLKIPNDFGLYDMLGNVWEWCADHWHDDYEGAPDQGEVWLDEGTAGDPYYVIRGGAWDDGATGLRAAKRLWFGPANKFNNLGFRCCRIQP